MTKDKMIEEFGRVFGDSLGVRVMFSPGRVNLIGDHTDYNGGHVFPCAITLGTYAAVRRRVDNRIRFYSLNFEHDGIIECKLSNLKYVKTDWWANYPKSVVETFKKNGIGIGTGFEMLIYGDLPNSSGLSSSASIEILTALSLIKMFNIKMSKTEAAKIGQQAENEFCGVNCGIMDQFAIAFGKKDNAIYLDTSTLEYQYCPIVLDDIRLVITNSNKKRGLAVSKYNERRQECETALSQIKESAECSDISSLGDLDETTFEKNSFLITDEVIRRRARHAVLENQRTIRAVEALNKGDIEEFGRLMIASHESLRDNYEVTGFELDTLFDSSRKQEGVIGTRMTGAGFGGCTVSLVKKDCIDDFIANVGKEYTEKTGLVADFYCLDIGGGPKEL